MVILLFEPLLDTGGNNLENGFGKGDDFVHYPPDGNGFGESDYNQVRACTGYGDGDLIFRIRG